MSFANASNTSLGASFFFDMRRVQPPRGSKDRRLSDSGSSPIATAEMQRRLEAATRDTLNRQKSVRRRRQRRQFETEMKQFDFSLLSFWAIELLSASAMHNLIINSHFGSKLLAARLPRTPPA